MLLSKHATKIAAAAKPVVAAKPINNKAKSVHSLPSVVVAAERKAQEAEKLHKEHMLAKAAKSAMAEYSTFQKHAKIEMNQENSHVKTLVTDAAKELMKEEALLKAQREAKQNEEGFWGSEKKAQNAATAWKTKMEAAEKAALDVIKKDDAATPASAENWHSYQEYQQKKIKSVTKKEAVLEKKQDQHIAKLLKDGKLKATTPLHSLEKKKAKPLTPQQQAALKKKTALQRANEILAKADKDVKQKVREIAQKELPRLESHLKNEVTSMQATKHWSKLQRAAAAKEKARETAWKKTVVSVHEKVAAEKQSDSVIEKKELRADKKMTRVTRAKNDKHLENQVDMIVGKSAAGRKVVKALQHIAKQAKTQHAKILAGKNMAVKKSDVAAKPKTEKKAAPPLHH